MNYPIVMCSECLALKSSKKLLHLILSYFNYRISRNGWIEACMTTIRAFVWNSSCFSWTRQQCAGVEKCEQCVHANTGKTIQCFQNLTYLRLDSHRLPLYHDFCATVNCANMTLQSHGEYKAKWDINIRRVYMLYYSMWQDARLLGAGSTPRQRPIRHKPCARCYIPNQPKVFLLVWCRTEFVVGTSKISNSSSNIIKYF